MDTHLDEVCDKMGNLTSVKDDTTSLVAEIAADNKSGLSGETGNAINSNSLKAPLDLSTAASGDEILSDVLVEETNHENKDGSSGIEEKMTTIEGFEPDTGKGPERRRKSYRVDILRCESLASLAPATLDRLFQRDYDIVVSVIPLPFSSVLPGPRGPIHFGPPSYSSLTPWMKLVLYSTAMSGPLSVVLMKGQCLRLLPAPLACCEKAFIWSWDGSTVGGLGGKFEGNLVKGSVLLHCLNSLLKYSGVLVQPLSRYDLDESGRVVTLDVPLPLRNFNGSVASIGEELGLPAAGSSKLNSLLLDISNKIELGTIGYIRLLKLFKERDSRNFASDDEKFEWVPLSVEFGIPLYSPKLCNCICRRVVLSHVLQSDSLSEHHDAMQGLRRRLREVCSEYQATGPAARILYQKDQHKDTLSSPLMTYASGRWNPLVEPSSPISSASSVHQRLKLVNRHRYKTEVLSFDGSILRSYALSPLHEMDPTQVDEPGTATAVKSEDDEVDSKEVVLPGVNLLFDGAELHPFVIGACLQARQPISLIAEASAASAAFCVK